MIGLLRSEVLRFRSRRLVWVLAALALLGILVGVGIGAVKSHRPSPAQVQQDQVRMAPCLAGARRFGSAEVPAGDARTAYCRDQLGLDNQGPGELQLSTLPDLLKGTSFILIVIGLVIGASAVGADWQSGTMSTLLTWEPRRVRLLLTRALVVAVSVFLFAVLLQVALSLAFAGAASVRGSTAATGTGFTHTLAGIIGRVGVVAALISLVGVAVSTVGRGTSSSLGVVFVYLALVESLLHGLVPGITRWLLSLNTAVFVDGKPQDVSTTGLRPEVITLGHASAIVIAYALILMALASVSFRNRDVS